MKRSILSSKNRGDQRGYASIAMVAVIGTITLFGLVITYRSAMRSHDSERRSQVRVDFTQKEDAFLRALVATLPNRAIDAMRNDSQSRANQLTWEAIFTDAIQLANAESAVSINMLTNFGLEDAVVANPGDQENVDVGDIVAPVVGTAGFVNPGLTQSSALLFDSNFSGRLPDPLETNNNIALDDQVYPIITNEKEFSNSWNTEADLSVSDYPLYNRIRYPNVQFGFKAPGNRFIAKRNWWAFSVTLGGGVVAGDDQGVPTLTKNYVLSLYEMPSQQPISADTFLKVGRHESGLDWQHVNLNGGINASVLETEGALSLPTGRFSSRRAMTLDSGAQAEGKTLSNNFDDLGVREAINAQSDVGSYGASLSANSGRVAFIPLNRGLDFYHLPAIADNNTISPTGWDQYSTGAIQCAMRLTVTEVEDDDDQTPTRLDFRFLTSSGTKTITIERGDNWPYENQAGGSTMPFHTEHTENGRKALVVYMERIPAYVAANGGEGPPVNRSLLIDQDPSRDADIQPPVFPSVETETVLVLRESGDLTPWAGGLSIVANMRLYFSDDFNVVETAPPPGSGTPAGQPFYPPVSVFSPEKRYGTTLKTRPVELTGQVGTLAQGEILPYFPLDLKAGTFETVNEDLITANLNAIVSPAQLPPIYLMNWMVTVEEVH